MIETRDIDEFPFAFRKALEIKDNSGTVLLVEDDESYAVSVVAPHFEPYWTIAHAYNVPQALSQLETLSDLRLAIIDLDLPGGRPRSADHPWPHGFEIVGRARDLFPATPLAVLTAHVSPRLINTAQSLNADYIVKGNCATNLRALAQRCLARDAADDERITAFVTQLTDRFALSPRQIEIVAMAVKGMRNIEIAQALGITKNTLKKHVDAVLSKCGEDSLAGIARKFRKAVWGG